MARAIVDGIGAAVAASIVWVSGAAAQQAGPRFRPGLYETESRNSAFKTQGIKSTTCIASADADAFRRETIAQYLKAPQFTKVCKLSEPKTLADGFVFAMDCDQAQTIIAFHFAEDFVSSTTDTKIVARPEYSSSILTLSRRIGDCKGAAPGTGP